MINAINKNRKSYIVTLEDPIEFVHQSEGCLVNQREVGLHTNSFERALRAALREDPDIVLVGDMSDKETVGLALETANSGHLVFGMLRTHNAVSTVKQVIDMFPVEDQDQVRAMLGKTLKAVIAQILCRRIGGGRVAAFEIMVPDAAMATLISEGKTDQLLNAMRTGQAHGNQLLNNELMRLVSQKVVELEEAFGR